MATWCLPPQFVSALAKAIGNGDVDVVKMSQMESSAERRALLAKYVGEENAKELNASFEKKLLLVDWKRGMYSWLKNAAGLSTPQKNTLINKVINMKEILSPADKKAFLADYVAKKLGTEVTPEEGNKISELARKAAIERDKPKTNIDGTSVAEIKAQSDLQHYVASLAPTTAAIEIGKNTIGLWRTFKIANPSVMIKAGISQAENHAMTVMSRRLAGNAKSGDHGALAAKAERQAWETFNLTGKNTALVEAGSAGDKLGEPSSRFAAPEGMLSANKYAAGAETAVRTLAKWTNKAVIDIGHNITFTKFYQKAFFDSLNIASTNAAIGKGLKGADRVAYGEKLFMDAANVSPKTTEGQTLRAAAQYEAQLVTNTNPNRISKLASQARDALNGVLSFKATKYSPAIGLGDVIIPMAKIPGAVIWNGFTNLPPVGLGIAARDIIVGGKLRQSDNPALQFQGDMQYARGWRKVVTTIGVTAAGALFVSTLDPQQDFRNDKWGHSFAKIGGVWVDTEYVSWLSPNIAAMMEVRKNVQNLEDVTKVLAMYAKGAGRGVLNMPGLTEGHDFLTRVTSGKDPVAALGSAAAGLFEPAFLRNLRSSRPFERLLSGAHGVETDEDIQTDEAENAQRRSENQMEQAEWNAL